MTSKKDTLEDKRFDELLSSVNNIQENMASKEYVAEFLKATLKEYHDRFNPNNLVVTKPSGMVVSGEQNTPEEQGQTQGSAKREEKKEGGPLDNLGEWGPAVKEGFSFFKSLLVPARDPRFDEIENMAIDITKNSMAGVVRNVANRAMRDGVTVHSGMTLDTHKD